MSFCRFGSERTTRRISVFTIGFAALATGAGFLTETARAQPARRSDRETPPERLYVDAQRGHDREPGTREGPLKTILAAIALLPDPLTRSVTIELAAGRYATTGGHETAENVLELMRRMRPGVTVRLIGERDEDGQVPTLAWEDGRAMVDVREGDWWLERVQVGTFSKRQRQGVMVAGPGHITLVTLHPSAIFSEVFAR